MTVRSGEWTRDPTPGRGRGCEAGDPFQAVAAERKNEEPS